MESVQMEELTSGASTRLIPLFRNLKRSLLSWRSLRRIFIFIQSFFLWFLLLLPRNCLSSSSQSSSAASKSSKRKWVFKRDEEDALRRRALAEGLEMVFGTEDGTGGGVCRWSNSVFFGTRRNALFCRTWVPVSGEIKGILIIMHGLNEHSGRYAHFARQLTSHNFGVYAMDWIGHGGSDGLHGYVPSLDHVAADMAACYPHIKEMLEGIVLTSPALRVKPAHPIVGALAPIFSLLMPRFQFKGANKRGIPVSRDPAALVAKYSDPLVYTGPIRVRTGHEILRISSYLMRNMKSVTIPFLVLHGTADRITDPLASQDLYNEAMSKFKDIKLYDGFLHDLLFEPEREEIAEDIINWMEKRLQVGSHLQHGDNLW